MNILFVPICNRRYSINNKEDIKLDLPFTLLSLSPSLPLSLTTPNRNHDMCTLSPRFAATTLDRCTAACRRPPVRHANRTHSPHFGWPIANRSSERRLVQRRHARPHPASGANKLRADRLSAVSFATADARCVCVSVCSVCSVFGVRLCKWHTVWGCGRLCKFGELVCVFSRVCARLARRGIILSCIFLRSLCDVTH